MKKLFFAMACVIGLMFFASCTQEQIDDIMAQKPTLEFVAGEGYITGNTSLYLGETLNFKVKAAPNSGSQSELAHLDFSITDITGATVFNSNPEITDPSGENIFEFSFTPEVASTYAVTVEVTDKANKANIITAVIDCVQPVVEGLGTFTGLINITGHVTTNEVQGYAYDDDYNIEEIVTTITMGVVGDDNRVSATLDIDGTPVTLYGTMAEGNITFDEFHFNRTINLIVDINLDLVMNMTGTLENDVLTLTGTAAGTGTAMFLFVALQANYQGVVDGTLVKVAEE